MNVKKDKIMIRETVSGDIDELLKIEQAAWAGKAASKEMILSRMQVFPEGVFCAVKNNKIVGFAANEIINIQNFNLSNLSWNILTDDGYISRSHDSKGDCLYGISISVPPYVADKQIAIKLYEYGGKLAIKYNLKKIYVGSRVPSYYKYANKMNIRDYVYSVSPAGRPLDPEIALYLKIGMKIEKIIPNYFKDAESLNYGVLVSWANPFYHFTKYSSLLAKIIASIFKV